MKDNPFVVGLDPEKIKERKWALDVFKERNENIFVLSPFGTGLDCFRTWEALIFGHIVIVKSSSLDELYEGLPVVIINDWAEINQRNLEKWRDLFYYNQTAQNNEKVGERLTTKYWYHKMKSITMKSMMNLCI